jgi:hypothetical protein
MSAAQGVDGLPRPLPALPRALRLVHVLFAAGLSLLPLPAREVRSMRRVVRGTGGVGAGVWRRSDGQGLGG